MLFVQYENTELIFSVLCNSPTASTYFLSCHIDYYLQREKLYYFVIYCMFFYGIWEYD